jgi:hypothetical protein
MSTDMSNETIAPTRPTLTLRNKIGLWLCVFLCLTDVASLASLPGSDHSGTAENGPPAAVLIAGAVLGLVGLVVAFVFWRSGNRPAARVLAGTRILSALSALPAFFVGGVPAALIIVAAVGTLITVIAVWLLLARPAD